nr:MAG TPA: hypothetical protein [Caudoviricetes sp.]
MISVYHLTSSGVQYSFMKFKNKLPTVNPF